MFLTPSLSVIKLKYNQYTFCIFFLFIKEFARTIRRNPETVLTEVVPKWEQYAPYIMTYTGGLPGCISMVEVFNDSDNSTGMTPRQEFTFYVVYRSTNAGIWKSSGKVQKSWKNTCVLFIVDLHKTP